MSSGSDEHAIAFAKAIKDGKCSYCGRPVWMPDDPNGACMMCEFKNPVEMSEEGFSQEVQEKLASEDVFDQAWDSIVKMPIVPQSFREVDFEEADGHPSLAYYEAMFQDPINADYVYPITAVHRPFYSPTGKKTSQKWAGKPFLSLAIDDGHAAEADFRPLRVAPPGQLSGIDSETDFHSTGTYTGEALRRRGYATALYDMAAKILHEYNGQRIVPSDSQSDDAIRFWQGREEWPYRRRL
jgi:hypothetical protein